MTDLARLVVALEAQTAKYQQGLEVAQRRLGKFQRDQNAMLSNIDQRFKKFGAGIGNALGAIGIGLSFKAIIDATAEAEKSLALLDNAVKASGGSAGRTTPQLADMAAQLQRVTTYGDDAIMGMQQLLLRFQSIQGVRFDRAQQAVLDLATALGTDLNSAAQLVGKALEDPTKGMTQLARSGVVLSDSQKDLIKNLDAAGRQAEAQTILLDELEKRYGGAAVAARNTFGGALEGLKNAFGDLLEGRSGVGDATAAINNLADLLQSPQVIQGFDTMISGLARVVEWSAKAAVGIADFARSFGEGMAKIISGPLPADALNTDEVQEQLRDLETRRDRYLAGMEDLSAAARAVAEERLKGINAEIEALKKREAFLQALPEREAPGAGAGTGAGGRPTISAPYDPKKDPLLQDFKITARRIDTSPMEEYYQRLDDLTRTTTERQLSDFARVEEALKELYAQGRISAEQFNERWGEAFDKLIPEVEVTAKKIGDTLKKETDKLSEWQKEATESTANIIEDGIFGAMRGQFDDIGKQFEMMVQRMVAAAITADIGKKLFGEGVGTGGGLLGRGVDFLSGLFGGSRDSGGAGQAGRIYKIGIGAQPEYFAAPSNGTFYPKGRGLEGGGGVNLVQNVIVQGRPDERTRRQIELATMRGQRAATRLA